MASDTLPLQGRLAGIDYGAARIGVAICDYSQTISSPLANYSRRSEHADAAYFQELASEEDLVGFVVGLPVHTDGRESEKSVEAMQFGQWLRKVTHLPVAYFDERYSSQMADSFMHGADLSRKKRKQRRDMLAAQIILAAYLEAGEDRTKLPRGLDE